MLLCVLSDASFLSRPNAGSVAGGLSYLGLTDDDDWVNHPTSCHSTRIPVVCSFVAEAEYAGLYAADGIATEERKIIEKCWCEDKGCCILRIKCGSC